MDIQRASEILDEFRKALKTQDYSIVNQYSLEELKSAMLEFPLKEHEMRMPQYKEMEERIKFLKEEASKEKKQKLPSENRIVWKIVIPIVVGIAIFLLKTPIEDHFNRPKVAQSIYIEVLSNIKEVNKCISTIENNNKINYTSIKFDTSEYDKNYKPGFFNNRNLDQQLVNFYKGIKKINPSFVLADFLRVKEHGSQSLEALSEIGGLEDYDKSVTVSWTNKVNIPPNVVSADSQDTK